MSTRQCKGCTSRTEGCTGFCRTCKFGRKRGLKRARTETLLVEQVIVGKPSSAWCAWDKIGNVMAGPGDTQHEILMELGEQQ